MHGKRKWKCHRTSATTAILLIVENKKPTVVPGIGVYRPAHVLPAPARDIGAREDVGAGGSSQSPACQQSRKEGGGDGVEESEPESESGTSLSFPFPNNTA